MSPAPTPPTLADVELEASGLSALISSLSEKTGQAATEIRTQIQQEALALRSDLYLLVNTSASAAKKAAGTNFDALITWEASTDAYLREKCIDAASSCQDLNQLVRGLMGFPSHVGTTEWRTQPEAIAQGLIRALAKYRSIIASI